MIDKIYFLGDNLISDELISVLDSNSVLITPKSSRTVDLSGNTVRIGEKIMELYESYDIVYLDVRRMPVTDIGMGILKALGCRFYNAYDEELEAEGTNLYHIYKIKYENTMPENKKFRLVLTAPGRNCTNLVCGLSFKTSLFEGELLVRSLHNLCVRLKKQGYDVNADLRSMDSGGISTLLSCILKNEDVKYMIEEGVDPSKIGVEINYEILGGKDGKSRLQG